MTLIGGEPNARPDSEEAIGLVVAGRVANAGPTPSETSAAAVTASSGRRHAASLDATWHDLLDGVYLSCFASVES